MRLFSAYGFLWLALFARVGPASAQPSGASGEKRVEQIFVFDEDERGVRGLVGEKAQAKGAGRALDAPAFVTTIKIADRELENTAVAEVLAETVGVKVRSLGGLGSFSALSVRGAPPGHTAVFVDGVPLSRLSTVTTDLGPFSLGNFSELSLYRGGVPVEYGGAGQGGALHLITGVGPDPDGRPLKATLGSGSFGARHASARWLGGSANGARGEHLSASYDAANGDYSYFDDGGTPLEPTDDRFRNRRNNGFEQVGAHGRVRVTRGRRTVTAGARGILREQGVPGPAGIESSETSLGSATAIVDGDLDVARAFGSPRLRAGVSGYGLLERQRYQDPLGEIGLGFQDRAYLTFAAGAQARAAFRWSDAQTSSAALDGRLDTFKERELTGGAMTGALGARVGGSLAIAHDCLFGAGGRWRLLPALRLDVQRTMPLEDRAAGVLGPMDLVERTEVFASPRLSVRYRVAPGLSIKGNAGRYQRTPTVVELFGDRGFMVGNPALRSETGESADLGLVVAPARAFGDLDRLYVEASAFATRSRDTIALSPSSGLIARAQNLGDARIFGAEAALHLRLGRTVSLAGNYTWIDTRQGSPLLSFDQKALPRRPVHDLYWRVDVAGHAWSSLWVFWADAHLVGANYLDAANLRHAPPRRLVGAGVKLLLAQGIGLGFEAKNLADQRVEAETLSPAPRPGLETIPQAISDFGGYPLPGRAFFFHLELQPKGF